ncbi:hypothetical protein GCM10023238_33250 [Streptomyces heliomycini]
MVCFNAAAARITAVPAGRALGRPLETALPLEDLEGRRWWQLTDPYGGLAIRVRQPERNLLLPGGREVLVSARYVRAEPAGPVRRVVVTLRDTEARRRTERSHAELIATVAHELRSPLTSVKGFTATLLAKWERFTDDQKRLMLETVDADADRVTRLIAELLDISRIDSGRLEVRRQPVDIGPPSDGTSRPTSPPDSRPTASCCGCSARCPICGPTPTRSTRCSATCWKTRCGTARELSRSTSRPRRPPANGRTPVRRSR